MLISDLRRRRSALFMPASNPRAIAKARTLPCDVVILDLEDAVAPDMKADARRAALAAVAEGGFGDRELVIRVNAIDTDVGAADLAAIRDAAHAPDAVLLPKLSGVPMLANAREALGIDTPLWAMIETAAAILALPAIASAGHLGLAALVAGTNDLALDLRCRPGPDRAPLLPALARIVTAARASGMTALDGVLNTIDDADRLRAECDQGRAWGFDGKTLIHPAQIAAANTAFGPTPEELAWAKRVIALFADPANAARGAVKMDGAMVERLHLVEARRLVALADPA